MHDHREGGRESERYFRVSRREWRKERRERRAMEISWFLCKSMVFFVDLWITRLLRISTDRILNINTTLEVHS